MSGSRLLVRAALLMSVLLASNVCAQPLTQKLHFELAADLRVSEQELLLPRGTDAELVALPSFIPEPLPGFGAAYGSVRVVVVGAEGQATLEPSEDSVSTMDIEIEAGDWVGVRNRFQAGLLRPSVRASVHIDFNVPNQPRVTLTAATPGDDLLVDYYSGQVEWKTLRAIDPVLTGMLFAALWDWLRALTFGMLWLLTVLDGMIGNIGLAIIALSLCVKILMLPLTQIADRLQDSVNRIQAKLQPDLDAIKREFKGEEAHEKTLAAFKEHGVHPLYTLKSLVGFLIQIPVFIAAFDMLGENVALNQASFLWIADLAKPDRWLALPGVLPFFGGYLNLLPCVMTAVTILTSWLQTDPSLTADLLHRQRQRLVLMAAAFFLLFYTFPAGMVLYWTTNNVLHLAKIRLAAMFDRRSGQ
jgi:YidC/Oxa1 family membrane protein insertase